MPDYFVKPAAPALLLAAAALIGLSTPAAAQTTTTAPDCASTTAPTGRMSVSMATPAQALSDQGFCNGIVFTADGVVNVAEAARNRIGTSTIPAPPATGGKAVSVSTGTAATANPDGRGTLNFSVDATVESRVGDAVDEYKAADDSRFFKSAPNAGRLKLIRITPASAGASPTVTFTRPQGPACSGRRPDGTRIPFNPANGVGVGGVGAQTLHFDTDGEVVLEESKGCYETFYDIGRVTTQMSGQGTLTFQNRTTSNFRGDVGTADKRLKMLTISNRDNINSKRVAVLGNIYADMIEVNTPVRMGELLVPEFKEI